MSNWRSFIEEILPFYFAIMIYPIAFLGYTPTTMELVIVYMFAFGVILFNNRIYQRNIALQDWGKEASEMAQHLADDCSYMKEEYKKVVDDYNELAQKYNTLLDDSKEIANYCVELEEELEELEQQLDSTDEIKD